MLNNSGATGFRAGIETGPDGESTGNIICYPSDSPNCKVVTLPKKGAVDSTGFLSLPDPTPFHDEPLIRATGQINEILTKVMDRRNARGRHLHVISTSEGPILAWVRAAVEETDDVRAIMPAAHD